MSRESPDTARIRELRTLLYSKPIEVTSGSFKFNSQGFLVEVYVHSKKDYERCDSRRLIHLLTYVNPGPVLTKAGTPRVHQPRPHKDEIGAFYIAQLIHYGLECPERLTNKRQAKATLLKAAEANNGEFVVPAEIEELQSRLTREYRDRKRVAD